MLHTVDQHHALALEDLVNDPIIATSGRMKALQFSDEPLAEALGVPGIGAENRS
jgi:hypothetical protein